MALPYLSVPVVYHQSLNNPTCGKHWRRGPRNVEQRLLEKSEGRLANETGTKQKQSRRGDKSIKQGLDSMRPRHQGVTRKKRGMAKVGRGRNECLSRTRN